MKFLIHLSGILIVGFFFSCNTSPSSPGGKLGTKNYYGNYTMGATSGPASVYLNATGDTLIELKYTLGNSPGVKLTNITLKENGDNYSLYKTDIIGTLTGSTTNNFGMLTWQYITTGNTIGFTGSKIP